MNIQLRRKRVSRSAGGDFFLFTVLAAGGVFMALPLVLVISNAFKPLNELFLYPPQFFVRNPTLVNFQDLFVLMSQSWVPMTRYFFNSIFVVTVGTGGHVILSSMGAYSLAKHDFPGGKLFDQIVVLSLMFAPQVVAIPNYLTMTYLGWIDNYAALVVPAWAFSLGLYLMRQFMVSIPDEMLEAARIDGAGELRIFWKIAMPIVKPAWLTLIILSIQRLWRQTGGRFIYTEQLKPLPYALQQIQAAGIARAGVSAAVMLLMLIIPVAVFVFNQSKVVETMGHSGID